MSSSFEKNLLLALPFPAITIREVKRQCPPTLNGRVRQTSCNALQRIKMLVCILKAVEQFRNTHLFRLKDHMLPAVVFSPVTRQDTSFTFHPLKQTSTWKGSQDIEGYVLNSS